jgi:hypothetical protein
MKMNIDDQLQLILSLPSRAATGNCRSAVRPRQRRLRRASLWFAHMRHVVDEAQEWPEAPVPDERNGRRHYEQNQNEAQPA